MLVDVPASTADATQDLQIVYAAPVAAVALRGTVDVPAPRLLLRAEQGAQRPVEVPLADLVWRLHLPSGYEVVRAGGTVASDEVRPPRPAALQLAGDALRLEQQRFPAGGCCRPATVRRGDPASASVSRGCPKCSGVCRGRMEEGPPGQVGTCSCRENRGTAPVEPN